METNFLYNVVKGLNIWTWTEGMTFSEKKSSKRLQHSTDELFSKKNEGNKTLN